MRSPSVHVLVLLALFLSAPALFAHDVTISGTQTFASLDGSSSDHDGTVNGVFTVSDGNLVVNGTVNCNDEGINSNSGCPMAFAVSGNMTINSGGALYAENRTAGGNGGAITLTVGGNLALNGTAIVSSASTSGNGTNGGAISVAVTGTVTLASGTTIDAGSANATGGNITIAAGSTVSVDGNVYSGPSRTLLSTRLTGAALDGGKNNQIGGAISISSTTYVESAIVIGANANIISQGDQSGTGGVTIDGCGVEVRGLVAALSLKESAAKVTIRSGKSLLVDARDLGGSGTRMGRVRADAPTGSAASKGVDLFAREDIQILGASTSGTHFAVSSIPGTSKSAGGLIRVMSTDDAVTASAKAIDVGNTLAGDQGGTVEISAKEDVNLNTAVIDAGGDSSTTNSSRAGGAISARSYSGDVIWTSGSGDVRPLGSTSGIALADQGTIVLTACGTVDTTGSSFPVNGTATSVFPETHTGTCSPTAPSLPAGVSALLTCNTPPVANDLTPSTNEDNTITITLSGTDADGNSLTFSIVSGPSHGSLGTIVSTGPTTATVNYTPALNYNGADSFVYQANDGNGGTDNANASITVVAVNDPPTFTIGSPITVLEDSGASTYTSWITSISAGPTTDETSSQTVSFNVTNNNNALFSVQPAVNSSGTLTFTLAANANGSATISVEAQDSGGIANGGDDTSNPQTSSITVTAVNDAPSFTCGANVIADSNGGAFSQANWASAISTGPANESGQVLTFEITANSNSAIFSVQPAVSAGGTLTFTPVAGVSGSANITIRLRDDGGIANSGSDTSASCSFTITLDAAPFVSSTSPANGTTNSATNVNLVITYSEPVNASGTAYTITCTPSSTSRPFVLTGNGTAVHTLDPNINLSAGQTCTVNILAAQISDVDADDPPNNMAANYSFSFTTDANPQIISLSPNDGSTSIAVNRNQSITWTEPVNMTSININCAASGAHTSVLSTSDNITWTVDPNTDFAQGELCTFTVLSATVTDVDANDPPDNPGPDISWQWTTDSAPSVISTTPANGATNLNQDTSITINYSEPVTASATAYTITCPSNRTYTLSGNGTATHTLTPNFILTAGQTCNVTVIASQISDVDAGDPPDTMAANYAFSFSVDANPQIQSISPSSSTGIATNTTFTITFTESVTLTGVDISCSVSGSHSNVVSASPAVTFTVDPDVDFQPNEVCTVTVPSANVTDTDTNDPPDHQGPDISFEYTTDAAPSVLSTTPASGTTNSASNVNIVITYDEPVTASGTAYSIQCNTNRSFVLSGNGTAVHTLDPNSNLPAGQNCTVTIQAAQISDVDDGDPPDTMAANYSFSFSVDANPQIISLSPNDGSTNVAVNANQNITWTEAVTMTSVNISCATSGSHTSTLSTSDSITWTVNPDVDYSPGELCTMTVLSASVTDNDANDPPDNPGPDISWSFTTDSPPTVTATSPTNGTTNSASNVNIVITYSEPVTASGTAYSIQCNTNRPFVLSGNGTNVHTLDPSSNLPAGQTCTVTIQAAQITDSLAANYSFSFSVDANPQILSTSPVDGSTVAANLTFTINWSESVSMSAVGINCTVSGAHTNVISAGPASSFTVDPDVDFTAGETCTISVLSANVTDADANDPPDNPGPDVSWQYTVDAAPSVTSTTPANGATNLAQDTNIVITYSEPVTASGTAYTITCPSNRTFTLSGNGTATHTLDPTSNLVAGQTCTVTVIAAQISDTDANDPPDTMAANYVFSFSIDANPQIQSTSPVDGTTGVATSSNITITFTESVSLTGVSINCTVSGAHTSTLSSSPAITFTVNPDVDFSANETCTVTVLSSSVSDTDANDPPDNMGPNVSWSFTTDAQPSVTTTTPASGATNLAQDTNIVITYSEPVTASGTAYTITCPGNRTYVLTGNGTATHTLDPTTNMTAGQTCTVTVIASQITDTDAGDPPDNLAANYVFTFSVDANPQIQSTSPNDGSTNVAVNSNITITFTESVSLTGVSISCANSGAHTSTLSASPAVTFTVNPDVDFSPNELCTVTVLSASVTDTDTNDPPDNMGPNVSWQFTTAP